MFRVRRIIDDVLPLDRRAIAQVQEILCSQFEGAPEADVTDLPSRLTDPLKYRFRTLLFVADNPNAEVKGFALVSHDPENRFLFLDYIASGKRLTGAGVGGALYQRVRDEARELRVIGVLCECAPDERQECSNEKEFKANLARLRFYERYGARPIAGTAYRTPIKPGDRGLPHLLFDAGSAARPLTRAAAQAIVRSILERKYGWLCSPEYIDLVVKSFRDDPVRLRPFQYVDSQARSAVGQSRPFDFSIALVVNDRHSIHHVRERGYVEAPVRIAAILKELEASRLFHEIEPRSFGDRRITAVHDVGYVRYLKRCCENVPEGNSIYPYVFPIRNATRPPIELSVRAGYYCIDTFTPLNQNAYPAARRAVDCTLTAADALNRGHRLAYALVRPPGHHAERRAFGGFCYFNSTAVAAQYLSERGRVAILDVDYHHGNGQQDIFYGRADILTISIHGHPRFAYPYFSGFDDERGAGAGEGYNINYPLGEVLDGAAFRETLKLALGRIRRFAPAYLVVALGFDPAKDDPTGTWSLGADDFAQNGRMIGSLRLPTLVVQEGGYRTRTLGVNARRFFTGLAEAALGTTTQGPAGKGRGRGV